MTLFPYQQDQHLYRQVVTGCMFLLLVFVESALGQIPGIYGTVPKLTVMVLFWIATRQPLLVSPWLAVGLGLVFDLIQGNPVGYSSAIFIAVLFAGRLGFRVSNEDHSLLWIAFLGICSAIQLVTFGFAWAQVGSPPAVGPLVFQFGLTVLLFPLIIWLGGLLEQLIGLIRRTS